MIRAADGESSQHGRSSSPVPRAIFRALRYPGNTGPAACYFPSPTRRFRRSRVAGRLSYRTLLAIRRHARGPGKPPRRTLAGPRRAELRRRTQPRPKQAGTPTRPLVGRRAPRTPPPAAQIRPAQAPRIGCDQVGHPRARCRAQPLHPPRPRRSHPEGDDAVTIARLRG